MARALIDLTCEDFGLADRCCKECHNAPGVSGPHRLLRVAFIPLEPIGWRTRAASKIYFVRICHAPTIGVSITRNDVARALRNARRRKRALNQINRNQAARWLAI